MNLITSKIIPASLNAFWSSLPDGWQQLPPCSLLVLTLPYEKGSKEEQTLTKMLQACKLTESDYHILTLEPGASVAWHTLRASMQPKYVLLLGIQPVQLGISALFRLHELNSFTDCTFMPSFSLQQLEQSEDAKRELWTKALKPCFS